MTCVANGYTFVQRHASLQALFGPGGFPGMRTGLPANEALSALPNGNKSHGFRRTRALVLTV